MRIGQADAETVQMTRFDHVTQFICICYAHLRQVVESGQDGGAVAQRTQREFSGDPWVNQSLAQAQNSLQVMISRAEMVDPDGGVSENHCLPGPSARNTFQAGHGAPERGQSTCAFALNKGLEGLAD